MTSPAEVIVSPDGAHAVAPLWRNDVSRSAGGLPYGLLWEHWCLFGMRRSLATWASGDPSEDRWMLEALKPLTVSPPIRCGRCNVTIEVANGRVHEL